MEIVVTEQCHKGRRIFVYLTEQVLSSIPVDQDKSELSLVQYRTQIVQHRVIY